MSTQASAVTNAASFATDRTPREPAPCTVIIFGASGDLARRKLIPALFDLASNSPQPRRMAIVGFGRSKMSDDAFRAAMVDAARKYSETVAIDEEKLRLFAQSFAYVTGDYASPEAFERLTKRVEELDSESHLDGNRLFYLATPPEVYPVVVEQLGRSHLQQNPNGKSWTRLIVEKPFGRDLTSARKLNKTVLDVFDESQVYRIDHYLGKDTVQNVLVFRFGNGIFEPLWNRNFIDHVQITAAEEIGIETRASFYETAGALRDMIQSHVLQVASLVAIEPPSAFDATAVRNEKIKVLQAIRPYTPELIARDVVRGQYGSGGVAGVYLPGYREEPGASKESVTETYVAARVEIDNWRWAGVPFYIRAGKRMTRRVTEIAIQFRRAPHMMFRGQEMGSNTLVLNIQPAEGISIAFHAKSPGQEMHLAPVAMDFSYQKAFGGGGRGAYATLINDCMNGDATLFDRSDGVEAAWALVDPILQSWQAERPEFPNYPAGSWGPREADTLLERDGRHWRKP